MIIAAFSTSFGSAAGSVAQFGLEHSAWLPGSGLELRFKHFINLLIDADRHFFPKL
jgi:hypothetical protein